MSITLLSIRPTYLLIKNSIINIFAYLSHELNYIYMSSSESIEYDYTELTIEIEYPEATTIFASVLNENDKDGWGFHVYIENEVK